MCLSPDSRLIIQAKPFKIIHEPLYYPTPSDRWRSPKTPTLQNWRPIRFDQSLDLISFDSFLCLVNIFVRNSKWLPLITHTSPNKSQYPEPRGDENDALQQWNVSRGDHKKWEEGSGDYEVGIRNFWGIKTENTYVSTANPGREEGRLLSSDVDLTGNRSVGVGMHVAPATQNFNPFLPGTQESKDWNYSPPGIDKISGAGVNKLKQLLDVNFLQRRDSVGPQQSGGGET